MTNLNIHDIAAQFDRLFPGEVDEGSGHIGHEAKNGEPALVGWFTDGGNAGNPVMAFQDVPAAGKVIAQIPQASALRDVERALSAAGISFERLV